MRRDPGRFVTFEGGEGSGKSTQWRLARDALEARGCEVVATREPGGTPLGQELRRLLLDPSMSAIDPRAELLMYCADRAQHTASVLVPALNRGAVVLCDRYADASVAYQGHARGLGAELVRAVDLARLEPDLTLLLDVPVALGLRRARARNEQQALEQQARFEAEETAFTNGCARPISS